MSIPENIRLTDGEEITWEQALDVAHRTNNALAMVLDDCQITLVSLEDPNELYLLNTLTKPEARRQGAMKRLSDALYLLADEYEATLVSHPDNDWLAQRMLARGWLYAPERPSWDGRPCMVRAPRKLEP